MSQILPFENQTSYIIAKFLQYQYELFKICTVVHFRYYGRLDFGSNSKHKIRTEPFGRTTENTNKKSDDK